MSLESDLGDAANTRWGRVIRALFFGPYGDWHVALRCRTCGHGYAMGNGERTGDNRWLCRFCGSDWTSLVRWIGRYSRDGHILFNQIWEWLPMDRLPVDLQPPDLRSAFERRVSDEVERLVPELVASRLDAEFEARVRAAVEVEMASIRRSPGEGSSS